MNFYVCTNIIELQFSYRSERRDDNGKQESETVLLVIFTNWEFYNRSVEWILSLGKMDKIFGICDMVDYFDVVADWD